MDRYYPVSLDLRGRRCLVVGGGSVAYRKVCSLLPCGALVEVASRRLALPLRKMAEAEQIRHLPQDYHPSLLEGIFLVISATDDCAVNRRVAEDATRQNTLVNVADSPELCSFILPASVKRGPLTISVSTGGKSPALARAIKEELAALYGPEFEDLVRFLGKIRPLVFSRFPDPARRREIFSRLADPALAEFYRRGEGEYIEKKILESVETEGSYEEENSSRDKG